MTNFKTRLMALCSAVVLVASVPFAQAEETSMTEGFSAYTIAMMGIANTTNMIDWKVGDSLQYDVSLKSFKLGTSVKTVSKDEGEAVWLKQEVKAMNQNEVIEVLINRADGRVLKMIRNGQEQPLEDNNLEVISQEATEITVKAGKFKAIHIVAKTKDIPKIEIWANPRETAIDGTLKQMAQVQFGDVVLELTKFKRN
jgi:hypothetical protein